MMGPWPSLSELDRAWVKPETEPEAVHVPVTKPTVPCYTCDARADLYTEYHVPLCGRCYKRHAMGVSP